MLSLTTSKCRKRSVHWYIAIGVCHIMMIIFTNQNSFHEQWTDKGWVVTEWLWQGKYIKWNKNHISYSYLEFFPWYDRTFLSTQRSTLNFNTRSTSYWLLSQLQPAQMKCCNWYLEWKKYIRIYITTTSSVHILIFVY